MLLPEYQSHDIESYFVSLPMCSIRFGNFPSFNTLFLPFDMGDLLLKAPWNDVEKFTSTRSCVLLFCFERLWYPGFVELG